ncbi:MAG: hypothetical protein WC873_00175 [Candidatus Gracilibacteria bacterium]
MEVEARRTLFFGGLLLLIVLFFTGYYFWANVFDRGTAVFEAKAPFTVDVYDDSIVTKTVDCQISPCPIKVKSGETNFILKKQGYRSSLQTLSIGLWQTVSKKVAFSLIPKIEKATSLPQVSTTSKYELVADPQTQSYKLISSDDINRRAIVYFQKAIKAPKIFSSPSAALIVDQSASSFTAYLINLTTKARTLVSSSEIGSPQNGSFSYDGKYFIFDTSDTDQLFLLDSANNIAPLDIYADARQTAWTFDGFLVFGAKQIDTDIYTIGLYNPLDASVQTIGTLPANSGTPKNFIPLGNGKEIYFQSGNQFYKIVLK